MPLPSQSWASRVYWSIPVAFILALWMIGILGAGVTRFNQPYAFAEVLAEIARGGWAMLWPGEFGRARNPISASIQVSPYFALLLWLACLVPWRKRRLQIGAPIAALIVPAWLVPVGLALFDWNDWKWLAGGIRECFFSTATGESWQEGLVMLPAMVFWWGLLLPLAIFTTRAKLKTPDVAHCLHCGYCRRGWKDNVCPECGNEFSPRVSSASDALVSEA